MFRPYVRFEAFQDRFVCRCLYCRVSDLMFAMEVRSRRLEDDVPRLFQPIASGCLGVGECGIFRTHEMDIRHSSTPHDSSTRSLSLRPPETIQSRSLSASVAEVWNQRHEVEAAFAPHIDRWWGLSMVQHWRRLGRCKHPLPSSHKPQVCRSAVCGMSQPPS